MDLFIKFSKKIYKKSIQDTHNVGHNPLEKLTNLFSQVRIF